jgi:uncharacterized Zn finger protein
MDAKERDEHEISCPHCGAEAEWSFLNEEKTLIEVMCQDCGRFEMPREDFDQAAVENVELSERR